MAKHGLTQDQVEEIKEAPRAETKNVMVAEYVPPPPPILTTTQVLLYYALPPGAVVALTLLLLCIFRRKILGYRRMRRLLKFPTDKEVRSIIKLEAASRGLTVRKRLDKGWRAELKKQRAAEKLARWKIREQQREEQARRDRVAAEKAEVERRVAEKLAAERAAAKAIEDQLAAERAAVEKALAEKAAAKAEEERKAAEQAAALEEATAALYAFANQAAMEKLEREKKEFYEKGPTPDHNSLPDVIKSDPQTRNGVGDARRELNRLMAFVGMRSPKEVTSPGKVLSSKKGGFSPTIV